MGALGEADETQGSPHQHFEELYAGERVAGW